MKRILLADSQDLFRMGLSQLIASTPDLEIVGQARNGPETIRRVHEVQPDLVILDVGLDGINGIDTTQRINSGATNTKVLFLTQRPDAKTVIAALHAGAAGYVLKSCSPEELREAIRIVSRNEIYLSPGIAGNLVDVLKAARPQTSSAFSLLTEREREVLQLLAEGQSASELADRLCISTKTIHTHRKNIMEKLRIQRFANLVKYAIQEGLTSGFPANNGDWSEAAYPLQSTF